MNNPFTVALLRWYEHEGRDLPWRASRDPYAVWLSEVILQQTRVEQGRAYWQRFLRRWPTVEALAAASEDEVMREWQGLGYYSRARHLLQAARQIAALGAFPDTRDALRRLPGVGDYTAAAVASLAFGRACAAVDGNVYRVLARHFGIDTPIDTGAGRRTFAALADELLPPMRPADFNSAMMDFGATLCTPQQPRCAQCPLQDTCAALARGQVARLPVKSRRTAVQTRRIAWVYLRCGGFTALRRRPTGDIWARLWQPVDLADLPAPLQAQARLLCRDVRHILTHRIILADFYLLELDRRPDALPHDYVWVDEAGRDRYGVPRLAEKLFEHLQTL